jgi:hypothetical protein
MGSRSTAPPAKRPRTRISTVHHQDTAAADCDGVIKGCAGTRPYLWFVRWLTDEPANFGQTVLIQDLRMSGIRDFYTNRRREYWQRWATPQPWYPRMPWVRPEGPPSVPGE